MQGTWMRRGFTLIELLVVVTIIVVLLALLVPSLDKAIYQAELAVCGSNLRSIGVGVQTYAMDHKRWYPHRAGVNDAENSGPTRPFAYANWRDTSLAARPPLGDYDDRPAIRPYINLNGHLNCPLNKALDVDGSTSHTEAPYQLWYGFQFRSSSDAAPEPGMLRLGGRLHFTFGGATTRFNVLASDMDDVLQSSNANFATHPDKDGIMYQLFQQDASLPNSDNSTNAPDGGARWTISRWQKDGGVGRGAIDRNFAQGDGSVSRITDITLAEAMDPALGEKRDLFKAPIFSVADSFAGGTGLYTTLPRE